MEKPDWQPCTTRLQYITELKREEEEEEKEVGPILLRFFLLVRSGQCCQTVPTRAKLVPL